MGTRKGARQGRLGTCHVRPPCPSLWEWRLIAVFQGTSTCMHCKPPRWVSHASVPCEWRLTALFQGMGTSKGCKTGLAGPCHERPPYPSLWQRRLTEVFQGMSTRMHYKPPCWVSHASVPRQWRLTAVFQGTSTLNCASPCVGCPTTVCRANGGQRQYFKA